MTLPTRAELAARDAADPLAPLRGAFDLAEGLIYLNGNSLGALPKATPSRLADLIGREWGRDLIGSWNANGWFDAPVRLGGKIARLIGAQPEEVIVADSTSVNLFNLAAGALSLRPDRRLILSEAGNFPTDLYVLQGLAALVGDGATLKVLPPAEVIKAIDETVAVVVLTHVHYKSGRRWPMAEITARAHAAGALVLWDLSHSAGALDLDLGGARADLAVGCGYKYLNGGPGAPAFSFVSQRHQAHIRTPLTGWMGHAAPFAFRDDYEPADGMRRLLCGTPSILGMMALEVGVDLHLQAPMAALEAKALGLGDLFVALAESRAPALTLASPRDPAMRGGHVSFAHPDGYAIMQALIARGVVGDFREPDILRFGFAPLYVRYTDVWDAVQTLGAVIDSREYDSARFRRKAAVT